MGSTILPSGENVSVTPSEILRYANPDTLRQIFRQERLRWNLKPNKDADYYSKQTLYKYSGDLHNEAVYQRMEIRTFPDNKAHAGYSGINNDSGEFGITHDIDKWDHSISSESLETIVNRLQVGSMAKIPTKKGYGLADNGEMAKDTINRQASILFDPYDGRAYLYSNDDIAYVNNQYRNPETKLPLRTIARIADIPTMLTDLKNDLDFISDPDYRHTDNNFTTTNKFVLDNIDDATFIYPEISKDSSGQYIKNKRIGLNGELGYGESDGHIKYNTQPDVAAADGITADRANEAIHSIGKNINYSGVVHDDGYLPGIFRSIEELESVDIVGQTKDLPTHKNSPGGKRSHMFYNFDGIWSPTWFDRFVYNDSYLAQSQYPTNMIINTDARQPIPYWDIDQTPTNITVPDDAKELPGVKLYQWRYNRVTTKYHADKISIYIINPGSEYMVGDILRWTFADEQILYRVKAVGTSGNIIDGEYINHENGRIFEQDPSTHGVGIPFTNKTGVGHSALLAVTCPATISSVATQIKNNLFAFVDVIPSLRSDNSTLWSDTMIPPDDPNTIVRSTASAPAYSGINSGRGGPVPSEGTTESRWYEHGGNATAGVHVHLFRYIIDTQNPKWVVINNMQVFTGKWVDYGPMGVERPCDIKALYLSNPDTNNFNNYYKFTLDNFFDALNRNPDGAFTGNDNTFSPLYIHVAQRDPEPNQKFTENRIDPNTSDYTKFDVTDRVLYINAATGLAFLYNTSYKNDPKFGYGSRPIGWYALAGAVTR